VKFISFQQNSFAKPVFFLYHFFFGSNGLRQQAAQVRGASLGRPVFPNIETFAS
jgi:hypothetical protein